MDATSLFAERSVLEQRIPITVALDIALLMEELVVRRLWVSSSTSLMQL
jgi:hypothetical protein